MSPESDLVDGRIDLLFTGPHDLGGPHHAPTQPLVREGVLPEIDTTQALRYYAGERPGN